MNARPHVRCSLQTDAIRPPSTAGLGSDTGPPQERICATVASRSGVVSATPMSAGSVGLALIRSQRNGLAASRLRYRVFEEFFADDVDGERERSLRRRRNLTSNGGASRRYQELVP